jgi:hypothetical protein
MSILLKYTNSSLHRLRERDFISELPPSSLDIAFELWPILNSHFQQANRLVSWEYKGLLPYTLGMPQVERRQILESPQPHDQVQA